MMQAWPCRQVFSCVQPCSKYGVAAWLPCLPLSVHPRSAQTQDCGQFCYPLTLLTFKSELRPHVEWVSVMSLIVQLRALVLLPIMFPADGVPRHSHRPKCQVCRQRGSLTCYDGRKR
jgi:hypothetical protein